MVTLALRSGIPVREWLSEDDRTIHTALELLSSEGGRGRDSGPLMRG